jgi:purine-binding chemotaxis protein CheW
MNPESPSSTAARLLIVRAGTRLSALPLSAVAETMRPLPVRSVSGAPSGLMGVARIRGEILPVVDLAAVVEGIPGSNISRFIVVKAGEKRVALAVEQVVQVADERLFARHALPALLGAATAGLAAIAEFEAELLLVLEASRLVPEAVWACVQEER